MGVGRRWEDDDYVSITVTSHVTHFPVLHGNCVTPSGRLPSVLSRPDAAPSQLECLPWTMHCTVGRSRHDAEQIDQCHPCRRGRVAPWQSTDAPQGHWWGSHILAPVMKPTAMWMALSSSLRPHPDNGRPCNQSPLCRDDTAGSRAWSTVLVSVFINSCLSAVTTGVSQADCLWAATPSGHGQV